MDESEAVVAAMRDQYLPRFSGGELPNHPTGAALALADRIDTLVGAFGINQIPTGDKDPYGLRRAAIGILRILIEKKIDLDLKEAFEFSKNTYTAKLENAELIPQLLNLCKNACVRCIKTKV